jgi:2-haloacid dehalogenase
MHDAAPPIRPALLLFDVNQTLLDLAPLQAAIRAVLPGADSPRLWFTATLQHAMAMSLAGRHAPLPEIGAAVLRMLAEGKGVTLSQADAAAALRALTRLPAHPDVAPALARLRAAGLRTAALSNSSTAGLRAQLAHAGLAPLLDAAFSVEEIGIYKPHPRVYLEAVRRMRATPAETMLVAAHGWDVAGAAWAGLQCAFVGRDGERPFPLAPAPTLEVPDLGALADLLGA